MAGILKVDTLQNSNASNIVTQTNSTTITIGTTGQTVALASGATSSGFGATYNGAVNWSSTVQSTGFTAVSGTGYFCNTTSAAFTVTLPATPTTGSIVALRDYAKTWNTNNLTIGRNGSNIEGLSTDYTASTQGLSVTLVYIDSTKGWVVVYDGVSSSIVGPQYVAATGGTVLTCGDYKTHVFTSSGCFVVSSVGNSAGSNSVEYTVVAGGGGGGKGCGGASCKGGGGGGAGGYRTNFPSPTSAGLPVTATTYPITIGGGGNGSTANSAKGTTGSNTIFSTITSAGGGGGGSQDGPVQLALSGGSGGGGGQADNPSPNGDYGQSGNNGLNYGSGNTPPVSPPQGNRGGGGWNVPGTTGAAGGGGGAGAVGACASGQTTGGNGGVGSNLPTGFFGPTAPSYGTPGPAAGRYFAGGGGGAGSANNLSTSGAGGSGGGGNSPAGSGGTAGTINTGGGGGGGGTSSGGCGASGIVLIRYKFQ